MAAFPDPRPQAQITTVSGPNMPAPPDPYVDSNITRVNVVSGPLASTYPPTNLSLLGTPTDRQIYASDGLPAVDVTIPAANSSVQPLPSSGNSWPIVDDAAGIPRGRDVYRNNGMIGQPFFNHSANS